MAAPKSVVYVRNYTADDNTQRTIKGNTYASISDASFAVPSGAEFVSWNTSRDGGGTSYAAGATVSALTVYAIWKYETSYIVTDTELTSIANAIRTKGGTSESLTYPAGFVSAIEAIPTGGDETLYVFTDAGYLNASAMVNNGYILAQAAFYDPRLIAGATVTFRTHGDFVLDTVTGMTSGESVPFTTVSRGNYTFTMPSESVYCSLLYDD